MTQRTSPISLASTLTCPHCGAETTEAMPTDACLFFWPCPACHTTLRPKPGDCCVFCSWGTVPCPPIQSAHADQSAQPEPSQPGCCAR